MASTTAGRATSSSLANRIDSLVNGVVLHWLLLFNLVFGAMVVIPWLAPILMHLGAVQLAGLIYWVYGFLCHQLPERSWFLFGQHFAPNLAEIQRQSGAGTRLLELRQFIGNPEMGWKVAWSDRMVSFYGGYFLFSLTYVFVRRSRPKWRGLRWQVALLLLLPMVLDGISHTISDLWGIGAGFRDTNVWLATLTVHSLSPSFYAGDAWGSFNSLARLATGLLAAGGLVFWLWPWADRLFKKV